MGRVDRPLPVHPYRAWVRLVAALILATLPILTTSTFSAPAAQAVHPVSYLPLIIGPPYFRIAFVSQRNGNEEIYRINVDGSGEINLSADAARDVAPDWSPDGRQIAFERDWNIYVMNADGSHQTYLNGGTEPKWSPDGLFIAFDGGDISVMHADGSHVSAVTKSKYGQNTSPAWSPDGLWIAFVDGDDLYHYGTDVCVINPNGFKKKNLSKSLSDADEWSPAWSPDGRWLAFESSYPFYQKSIYMVHVDGSNLTRLAAGQGRPAWSPDGRQIAFEKSGDIYKINVDGSGETNLTTNPADDTNPTWSPDGRRIAFVSQRDGNAEIYVMSADGSNQTRLTTNPEDDTNPVWSPTSN